MGDLVELYEKQNKVETIIINKKTTETYESL